MQVTTEVQHITAESLAKHSATAQVNASQTTDDITHC